MKNKKQDGRTDIYAEPTIDFGSVDIDNKLNMADGNMKLFTLLQTNLAI